MDIPLVPMIKIVRGNLTQQIKNTTQKELVSACERLGLWVADGGGKGSHVAV